MRWIYRLERKLGRGFGIHGLVMYVTATMLVVYLMWLVAMPQLPDWMILYRPLAVTGGQVWRFITFLLVPPISNNVILVLLGLYVTYHLGSSLESAWGTMLFNLYYFLGAAGAIIAALISGYADNYYIYLSMFLAYCYLYPEATFMIFFILPVKAKYLAIFNWALYIWAFIQGNLSSRLSIVFSLINFFIFFGPSVLQTMKQNYKTGRRRRDYRKNWGGNDSWR